LTGKTGQKLLSQFVLTISNWHFVRDIQNFKVLPVCAIKDCIIGLKLSSTAFKPQSLDHSDGEYHFDKNGLLMPYTVFLDFMSSIEFKQDFMDLVKQEYENRGNKIDNDDNESAIAAILAKAVEREAEVTKLREAAKEEYLNTLLEARIAHGSQGISPRCYSVLHVKLQNIRKMSTCYSHNCVDFNKIVVSEADSTQTGDPIQVETLDLSNR
jgi:hypothetical protein